MSSSIPPPLHSSPATPNVTYSIWEPKTFDDGIQQISTSVCWEAADFKAFTEQQKLSYLPLTFIIVVLILVVVMIVFIFLEQRAYWEYKMAKKREVKPQLTLEYLKNLHRKHKNLQK